MPDRISNTYEDNMQLNYVRYLCRLIISNVLSNDFVKLSYHIDLHDASAFINSNKRFPFTILLESAGDVVLSKPLPLHKLPVVRPAA